MNTGYDNNQSHFFRLAVIAVAILASFFVLYILRYIAIVLFVAFAGILFGIFLDSIAGYIAAKTPIPEKWAVAVVIVLLVVLLFLSGWILGPRIVNQIVELADRLPRAFDRIRSYLESIGWGQNLLQIIPSESQPLQLDFSLLQRFGGFVTLLVTALGTAAVILFIGIFIAFNPSLYLQGVLSLVPQPRVERFRYVLHITGKALRYWLIARILSMVTVGVLTAIGLLIIGVPLWFSLGLIAGLLAFIPYLGPILSFIPAILVVLPADPSLVIWIIVVYAIVQFLESNIITPLIEQKTTTVPAALLITVQLLLGILVGILGIFLASPVTVAIVVCIQLLYIEDVLHRQITVAGENKQ